MTRGETKERVLRDSFFFVAGMPFAVAGGFSSMYVMVYAWPVAAPIGFLALAGAAPAVELSSGSAPHGGGRTILDTANCPFVAGLQSAGDRGGGRRAGTPRADGKTAARRT